MSIWKKWQSWTRSLRVKAFGEGEEYQKSVADCRLLVCCGLFCLLLFPTIPLFVTHYGEAWKAEPNPVLIAVVFVWAVLVVALGSSIGGAAGPD